MNRVEATPNVVHIMYVHVHMYMRFNVVVFHMAVSGSSNHNRQFARGYEKELEG